MRSIIHVLFIVTFLLLTGITISADEKKPFGAIDLERLTNAKSEPGQWMTGGRDFYQTYYSPLNQINVQTVRELGYAWHKDLDTTHGLEATPIVVDGVLYASLPLGKVVALDAKTGETIWSFDPKVEEDVIQYACCGVVNRGLAVYQGMVYVAALDGRLFALDAKTGEPRWHVDTIVDHQRTYTITGAPYIADDVVVIGNSGAEYDARGYISAYDVKNGELQWRFFTVPGDPSQPFEHPELEWAAETWDPNSLWEVGLGGTVWDGMAYDPDLNLLYVGTGNGTPYPREVRSPSGGDNLFLASILAINPDTGRLAWYYQTTPGENWDYTATQKMILTTLPINGRERRVLLQAPKNGFFYVLDRETGELLSAKAYVPVNWASHVDRQTGRPIETAQSDYSNEPKLIFPSPMGGHNWQPMAYNPNTKRIYIPSMHAGAVFRMPEEPFQYKPNELNFYTEFFFAIEDPIIYKDTWISLPDELIPLDRLTAGQPDPTVRGALIAWDPVKQKKVWEVDTSGPWKGKLPAAWNGGGVMTTAGNLVVQGRTTGELYFYKADTGERVHSIDVGSSIIAAPATYMIDDEQYIVVMAGLGGASGREYAPGTAAATYGNQGRIVALKLGGDEVPKRPVVDEASKAIHSSTKTFHPSTDHENP